MSFSYELTYDADVATVAAMLADPAFRETVCARGRSLRHRVEVTPRAEQTTVVIDQTLPSTGVPSFARRIVGDEIQIVQTETWHGHRADLAVAIPGKPGSVAGDITLTEAGAGTVQRVSGDVSVKVPLVGGKLEKLIADILGSALRSEQRVGRAWLAGDR